LRRLEHLSTILRGSTPYRDNAVLRGPEHLLVAFERLAG
jgi:hypothetical protein